MIGSKLKDQIVKMWEEGLSGSQIGEKLNLTRNAVIGMISRLKRKGHVFARDEKDQHRKRVAEERRVKEDKFAEKQAKKEKVIIIPKDLPVVAVPSLPTRSGGIELLDLKRTSCRFIVSGDDTIIKYCGEQQSRSSYCAEHYSICYYPARGNLEKILLKR